MASPLHVGRVLLLASLLMLGGCSSVGGSAIRTGAVRMPAYSGPVAIYAVSQPPPQAVDLGVVEVHASQQEATVDTLLNQFVQKVAQIGGNVAVIEGTRARFQLANRAQVDTFYYNCASGAPCAANRVMFTNDEIMVVSMFGRAMTTEAKTPEPLLPPTPPGTEPPGTEPPTPPGTEPTEPTEQPADAPDQNPPPGVDSLGDR